MPQSTVSAVLLSADVREERADPKTGEVYKAEGVLYLLDSDRGEPVITRVKCTPGMARKYQEANTLRVGEPLQLTRLLIDTSEYNVNGRSGISRRLVEADSETARPRGSFKLEPAAPPRPAGQPSAVIPNAQAQNGQRLAPAGS